MACSNCYNGCAQVTSDKCVKYTGVDVPALGIENGDTLCSVEQALSNYLLTALDGTGIIPAIDDRILCTLVSQYLPVSGDINLVDIVAALIQALCDLQGQIDDVVDDIAVIEANYTVGCLEGVTADSGTHAVVQAIITSLCGLITDYDALVLALPNEYVKLVDLDGLIQAYLDSQTPLDYYYLRMVPYVAYPYYGSIADFSATGQGNSSTVWKYIYLCNGFNGTPDMRGRIPVGATDTPGTIPMDANVLPGLINPTYSFGTKVGSNGVILTESQLPAHTHANTATATQDAHTHLEFNSTASGEQDADVTANTYSNHRHDVEAGLSYRITGNAVVPTLGLTSPATPSISVSVTNGSIGSDTSHPNYQPGFAMYYIMYIPAP